MAKTTQSFYENSIYKWRNTEAEIAIDVFDYTAKGDITTVNVNEKRLAHLEELYDNQREYNTNLATGELGQFNLNGSMTLMPDDTQKETIGWWTNLSDDDGKFIVPQIISFCFSKLHSTAGITCHYDSFSKPVESICRWYKDNELLAEEQLIYPAWIVDSFNASNITTFQFNNRTANSFNYGDAPTEQAFVRSVDGFNRIEIEICHTQNVETYAKMIEIDFGLIYSLTGDQMQGSKLKEEVSLLSNTLYPNELSFSLENYDRKYDLLNPNDLLKYFKKGQEVRTKAAVKNRKTGLFEWINLGKFYLDPPSSKSAKLTCKAYGVLNKLLDDEDYYSQFFWKEKVNVIIKDILNGYEYYVHPNVADIELTGYIPTQNKKDALKVVAIAVGAVVKEGRDGRLYFYRATKELVSNQIILEDTVYTSCPSASLLFAGVHPLPQTLIAHPYILKADRSTRISDIDSKDIGVYSKVAVNYFNYSKDDNEDKEIEIFSGEVVTDEDGKATISFSEVPVYDANCVLPEGCTIAYFADVSILQGFPQTIYELVIKGKKRKVSSAVAKAILPQTEIEQQAQMLVLDSGNELIGSATQGQWCAKWYLEQLQKRYDISFKWWAVATTEASDFIEVETTYDKFVTAQINSIEYDLGNGLTATVKGVA